MKKNNNIIIIVLIVVLAVIVIVYKLNSVTPLPTDSSTSTITDTTPTGSTVAYSCDAGKTITAVYYEGTATPSSDPSMPPVPGESVALNLSDGRTMTLVQTISADGTRYANADESFVFWGKGNGAIVLENNQSKSFVGCIMVAPDSTGTLSQVYSNSSMGFSLRLPVGYTTDASYKYQDLGPGKDIYGTKFTIPTSLTTGTNLGSDSYVSVEELPKAKTCSALSFVSGASASSVKTVTENDTTYSMITSGDAGAGNRYDETVYAIPGTNPCIAVRYFIHYGAYANYDATTTKEFDEQALVASFDKIRRTLVVNH